jgi:signal transduction histidine kinase/ActR/RegA family two-component response regulator
MGATEELREALLDLEESRKLEEYQRQMAEVLLSGLRVLVLTTDSGDIFPRLFEVLAKPLDFQGAFVLEAGEDGTFRPVASSYPLYTGTLWKSFGMFNRVIAGQPVAVFDTNAVDEWRFQPDEIRRAARSALHFSIASAQREAIFVCTHPARARFTQNHIRLARRFSVLAIQALQKLESEAKLTYLEERLAAETRLSELNMKLAESEKKLARARKMESLGLLAGGVAHDLNNILAGVVGYPELLLMDESLSMGHRKAIETIRDSGLRAAAVVQDLLTVARGVASVREPLNLNDIVRHFLRSPEFIQFTRGVLDLQVTTDLEPNLLNVSASRLHVEKGILNLVSNAIEATINRVDRRIVIKTENRYVDRPVKGYDDVNVGEYALLTVSDNGTGILNEDLERIFEPFYAKKSMGRSGTGLGLTIVWNTMQDHDGYVDVTSSTEGTDFTLFFPITRDLVKEEQFQTPIEHYAGKGESVLVVDDQEDQRMIACAMLTKLGYKADAVPSGEEAVLYVKRNPVDLLLLDMIMVPGMDGRATYEEVVRSYPGQKAVIASGYSLTDDVKAAQRLGAGRYIKKPYTIETLGIAVKDELAEKGMS